MSLPPPFTQAQLEIAVGGADQLLELADKRGECGALGLNGAPAQAFIAEVQRAVAGRLYSILQVAFDPTDPMFQGSDFVQQLAVTMGAYWAWHKSTGGIAIPQDVKEANADAEAMLKDTRDGGQGLGTLVDPRSNAGARNVRVDQTGRRVLRKNMGGFC